MTTLALMYPSLVFARDFDPLRIGRDLGAPDASIDQLAIVDEAEWRIRDQLAPFAHPAERDRGPMPDQRWYWVAPLARGEGEFDTTDRVG